MDKCCFPNQKRWVRFAETYIRPSHSAVAAFGERGSVASVTAIHHRRILAKEICQRTRPHLTTIGIRCPERTTSSQPNHRIWDVWLSLRKSQNQHDSRHA